MNNSKYIAETEINRCVACGVCAKTCPRQAVTIYKGKYAIIDKQLCIGCGLCVKACPASIMKRVERN